MRARGVYGEITGEERSAGRWNLRGRKNWKLVSWKKESTEKRTANGVSSRVSYVFSLCSRIPLVKQKINIGYNGRKRNRVRDASPESRDRAKQRERSGWWLNGVRSVCGWCYTASAAFLDFSVSLTRHIAQMAHRPYLKIYTRVRPRDYASAYMRKRLLNIESPSARDLQIGREILKFPFAHAENFNTRAQF